MKKLLKRLFDFGSRFNARWNPWILRREIRLLETFVREYSREARDEFFRAVAAEKLVAHYQNIILQAENQVQAEQMDLDLRILSAWNSLPEEIKNIGDKPIL